MNKPKRIFRNRKLAAGEIERDNEIRRKVQQEFPPRATSSSAFELRTSGARDKIPEDEQEKPQ